MSDVRRRDGVDLDAEREVDLRSAWTRISDALVAPARRSRRRSDPRRARLGRNRRRLPRGDAHLPRPALHPGRRRTAAEPPDEPEDGERDRSQRGSDQGCGERRRHAPRARCAGTSRRPPSSSPARWRATSLRSSQIEVRGPTKVKAEKASNSFANTVVKAGRPLHQAEDEPPRAADRGRRGAARGHRCTDRERRTGQQRLAFSEQQPLARREAAGLRQLEPDR